MIGRKRDTSKKRESILDAAAQAFINEGYDNAGIAVTLRRTEEGVKSTRAKLRTKLLNYCTEHTIDIRGYTCPVGGWRPAHHYSPNFRGSPKKGE